MGSAGSSRPQITYVIQNMEALSPWVLAEYQHIPLHVEPSRVVFTAFPASQPHPPALDVCRLTERSVEEHIPREEWGSVCLLDEEAPAELSPEDAGWVRYVLVGGILGDEDVDDAYQAVDRDRTRELRKLGFPTRHLGPLQMTLDHACIVSKLILEDGIRLADMEWVDRPWFRLGNKEEIQIPFRYLAYPKQPEPGKQLPQPSADLVAACQACNAVPMLAHGLFDIIKEDNLAQDGGVEDDDVWG
ncbi:hypothetical protein DFJ74DRAFT_674717 [Hyaloraphidium curvatum]|nr:hypothetical protein DFJ74DRAFT_674717 [Hyaloraphidium curvatum]